MVFLRIASVVNVIRYFNIYQNGTTFVCIQIKKNIYIYNKIIFFYLIYA